MAKVTIQLKHCVWRNGRPRFQPGPKLRRLGFKGEDLRHEDGAWYTLDEAAAWVEAKEAAIAAARTARRPPPSRERDGVRGKPGGARPYTVADLFEDYFRSPRLSGSDVVDGRRRQRALSPRTIADYKSKARTLEAYDAELYGSAVAALDQPILYGLYEELWRDRGLSAARGTLAVLSSAISWGMRRGKVRFAVNPALRLGMEMPEPRVRAGEPEEMRALVAAADALGRPEIGDSVVLALWTGQRQGDRLALVYGPAGPVADDAGRRIFRQSKTGAIVAIRPAPELEARLAASRRRRRKGDNVEQLFVGEPVILDEAKRGPWGGDHYRHSFTRLRRAAAFGVLRWRGPGSRSGAGRIVIAGAHRQQRAAALVAAGRASWLVQPTPSLADFQERDLRDTAVTWLARAGATIPEICAVTGHSEASAATILRHYLARHPELADSAIAKMITWYATKG